MLNSRKRIVLSISVLAIIFFAVIGITYAYYATIVFGNTSENPSLILKSGYLSINYNDGTSSITGGSTGTTTDDLVFTKTFTVTNDGKADAYYGVRIKNYEVYTLDDAGNKISTNFERPMDWTYELKFGDVVISSGQFPIKDEPLISTRKLALGGSETLTLTVTYNYITEDEGGTDQSADMNKILSFDVSVTQSMNFLDATEEGTLLYAINRDNEITDPLTIPGRESSTQDEAAFAATEDHYGTSYYFRGNVVNNFVTFAGKCWRIVRVQGDGTIKLILADRDYECGPNVLANEDGTYSGYSTENMFSSYLANITTDNYHTFTYKYLNSDEYQISANPEQYLKFENSDVPTILNAWLNGGNYTYFTMQTGNTTAEDVFAQNIDSASQEKLVETEWCNDLSEMDSTLHATNNAITYEQYGAYVRLTAISTATPTLKCNQVGLNSSRANKYQNIIGILTADEVVFAGGTYNEGTTNNSYLSTNANVYSLTMTPASNVVQSTFKRPYIFMLRGGYLTSNTVFGHNHVSIRPVIVLKSDVLINTGGNGTQDTPYVITE